MDIIFSDNKWQLKPKEDCFIYCWENQVNHKKYIGQTIQGIKRLYDEKNLCNINSYFTNAINKYGEKVINNGGDD